MAGIEIGGAANRCAPILGFMRRWDYDEIVKYCEKKGWLCEKV